MMPYRTESVHFFGAYELSNLANSTQIFSKACGAKFVVAEALRHVQEVGGW